MCKLAAEISRDLFTWAGCALPERERQSFALSLIFLVHSCDAHAKLLGHQDQSITELETSLSFKGLEVTLQRNANTM